MTLEELYKRFKFGHADKWYKPESTLENKVHKIIWVFEVPTDHPVPARNKDLVLINKKKMICYQVDFTVPADNRVKIKESKKI